MATNRIKSVGNILGQTKEYWQNAAKQFVWPIDFEQLHISVPEKDLDLAGDNLMVSHFKANGWHIQSAIAVEYTKPFIAPENNQPIFPNHKKQKPVDNSKYKPGDQFRIKSTEQELEITFMDKDSIELKYINRTNKAPVITNEKQLTKSLNLCAWIRI